MEIIANKIYSNEGNTDVKNLVGKNAKYILDLGCGNGNLARQLSAMGYIVDGVSISSQEIEIATPFLHKAYLQNLEDGLPQEMDTMYDVVICSHVLEHICYPDKLLKDINKVLKDSGTFIVALPNIMHYKSRIELMKGNFYYTDAGIWDNTHFKWYTFQTAKSLLIAHGFEIELATVTGSIPLKSFFSRFLPKAAQDFIFRILTKISKGLFGYQLLYKAKKRSENS